MQNRFNLSEASSSLRMLNAGQGEKEEVLASLAAHYQCTVSDLQVQLDAIQGKDPLVLINGCKERLPVDQSAIIDHALLPHCYRATRDHMLLSATRAQAVALLALMQAK